MGRNSNDDRSDGMNPNNDAYHANEANHHNQIDAYDDDDDVAPVNYSEGAMQKYPEMRPLCAFDDGSEDTCEITILTNRELSSDERALNSFCEALLSRAKSVST